MVTRTTRTVEEFTTTDGKTFTSGIDAMKHENAEAVKNSYNKSYGIWHVTTEGDCEGRSTADLGFHEGYLDDIAFFLADKNYYSLRFKAVVPMKHDGNLSPSNVEKVSVRLDYSAGLGGNTTEVMVKLRKMLHNRRVEVNSGPHYASVTLSKIK